jgi:hypothetical protein
VYVNPELNGKAGEWLKKNREKILATVGKQEDEGE